MNEKIFNKWIMYHEVHKLHRKGYRPLQISKYLVMDIRTVRKYLAMSEEEYLDFLDGQSHRNKVLAPYEDFVKTRLEDCPDASAAQVHDWMKECIKDFIDVSDKTVFNFVLFVRTKYGLPKSFTHRDFCKVEELPYGKQAQVDFGEYNMTTDEGGRKKIYFFSIVLSRSRYKYGFYQDHPFTTLEVIFAHELAFVFFGGIPEVIVYDQDTLLLISENKGDLILTEAFRKYAEYRAFKTHFCRKSDPQSKGKVENVIRYAKYNFLRGRRYINDNVLNVQSVDWLERTANAKEHSSTKKIPYEEWLIEKDYLRPILGSYKPESSLDEHDVIKDGSYVKYYCYLEKKIHMSIEEILKEISELSSEEKEKIIDKLIGISYYKELPDIKNIRQELHESHPIECPYCKSSIWIKYGSYRGSQKYRCSECTRTFTSLTGSSAYRIHDKEKWTHYFSCLLAGYSLHKCATEVGISYKTSFNWRHKILRSFRDIGRDKLTGVIEADETYFLDSKKGQKVRGRTSRKRGGVGLHGGPSRDHIAVVVATDRSGRIALKATGKGKANSKDITEALGMWVVKRRNPRIKTVLCTDQYTAYDAFARKKNLLHKKIPSWDRKWTTKKIFHLQHVNNVHSKLKKWIRQFNGVSSKYLPNYLIYFKIQEIVKNLNNQEAGLIRYSLKKNNTYLPVNKFKQHFNKQYYCT